MKTLAFLLLLSASLLSADTDQTQSGFRYGERPKNSVFDPAGILTPKEQAALAEPLAKVRESEGIDVMVVILPEIQEVQPEHVAAGFAQKWAMTKVNAVVLHVPGKDGTPWIFPGDVMNSILKPGTLRVSMAAAEKRAAAEPTDFGKVRAASTEASDAIRYWMGVSVIRSEQMIDKRLEAQLAHERRQRLLKLAAVLGAAALIPLAATVFLIVARVRNARPRFFPHTRVVPRLGAPYSGGNNAVNKAN
ncbi:MAG: hypothetical protein RLZZ505_1301 [Verrucomicrobiota bacterium]|jgi:hypothetical protein